MILLATARATVPSGWRIRKPSKVASGSATPSRRRGRWIGALRPWKTALWLL